MKYRYQKLNYQPLNPVIMKHFKKLNQIEKKFKITSSLKIFLFWIKQSVKALFSGILVSFLTFSVFSNLLTSLFLGIVTVYLFIGTEFLIHSTGKILINFVRANGYLSLLAVIVSIILLLFLPTKILGTVILFFGIILLLFVFMIGTNPTHLNDPPVPIK